MKETLYKAGYGILFGAVMFSFFFICLIFVFPTKLHVICISLVLMTFMQMLFYMYTELMTLNRYYEMMLFDEEDTHESDMQGTCCNSGEKNVVVTGYTHKVSFDKGGKILSEDEQTCCGGTGEKCHCNKQDKQKDTE